MHLPRGHFTVATLCQQSLHRRGKSTQECLPSSKMASCSARPLTLRAALMRVEGWILRHQAIASVSLHLPHKALAAMDASNPSHPQARGHISAVHTFMHKLKVSMSNQSSFPITVGEN